MFDHNFDPFESDDEDFYRNYDNFMDNFTPLPDPCKGCPNAPKNGEVVTCFCILATPEITV